MKSKLGKPFEDDGKFYVDKGERGERPRALVFRTHDNFVGFSTKFRRREAYEAAFAAKARSKYSNASKT